VANAAKQMCRTYIQGRGQVSHLELLNKTQAELVDVAWCLSVREVEAVIESACHKALADTSVSANFRKRRAERLKIMGEIILQYAGSTEDGLLDYCSRNGINRSSCSSSEKGVSMWRIFLAVPLVLGCTYCCTLVPKVLKAPCTSSSS
jgi:hypothetical protein